ncbi:MAG: hypothetical protein GF346_02100 [Candidatus Eisenbacteria bacterium]|nr:hypothetical protein [Candidatus Latescibacterota bacterium]MBD3301224.1 hypothetical protein [Candidatus Eisenbacteria bacterium]
MNDARLLPLFGICFYCLTSVGYGDGWEITAIETHGSTGDYTSIAVDSSNQSHVSYEYSCFENLCDARSVPPATAAEIVRLAPGSYLVELRAGGFRDAGWLIVR